MKETTIDTIEPVCSNNIESCLCNSESLSTCDEALDEYKDDDDSEMPEPETKSYEQFIKCSDKFMGLFMDVIGKLPYASVLKNNKDEQIKLIDLVKFMEKYKDKVSVNDMNHIISFIAGLEFRYSRQLMEQIENPQTQATLWTLIQD